MVEIKKILVNIQFDGASLKALELAKDLAKKYNSQLVVFHEIVDVYMMKKVATSFGMPVPPDTDEKSKKSALEKIEDLLADFNGDKKVIVDISGRVKDALPKFVSEEKPDLLIITDDYEYINKKVNVNTLIVK
ncbi:universal stress protein [Sulfurihydrogenibium subterraneum]|uniref:universal stress protein n=1 Tax=Sulfurihydrogenibium subterraneum TaxID=171121 RepID=UPI00048F994B|nr:universal stress protein [Sulfurihydrogenibium subterraneum]